MTSQELRDALIELETARAQGLELRSRPGIVVAGIDKTDCTFSTMSKYGVHYQITASLLFEWLDALQEWRESSPKATPEHQAELAAETGTRLLEERLTKLEDLISRKLEESMTARHGARIQALEEFIQEKFKDFK